MEWRKLQSGYAVIKSLIIFLRVRTDGIVMVAVRQNSQLNPVFKRRPGLAVPMGMIEHD